MSSNGGKGEGLQRGERRLWLRVSESGKPSSCWSDRWMVRATSFDINKLFGRLLWDESNPKST